MGKLNTLVIALLCLCFTMIKEAVFDNRYCKESLHTMQYVNSCPLTEHEASIAAKQKNCKAIAQSQNCTDPARFKYHCVINELENSLLEVCAPEYYILGYCVEFNVQGGRIQEHYNTKCSDVTPECPSRYKSTEAHLYLGCYEVVNRSSELISTGKTTNIQHGLNITNGSNGDSNVYTSTRFLLPVVLACLGIVIGIIVLIICWRRGLCRKHCNKRQSNEKEEGEATELMLSEKADYKRDVENNKVISTLSVTDELAVSRGDILLKMVEKNEKVEDMAALSEDNIRKTEGYIEAFRDLCSYFIETSLSKQCKNVLQKYGVAILTGPSGSGKTLVALHIMKDPFYDTWDKRKISSWREFRFIDPRKNSFVLIDNIFDGHIYRHGLDKWWDTLSSLYCKYIKNPMSQNDSTAVGNVHLLITAKDSAITKASEFMNREMPVLKDGHTISTSSFPLSPEEKTHILDAQLNYAHEKKNIERPIIDEGFRSQIMEIDGPFGFPLCAHLYACEHNYGNKDLDVFRYPEKYQRNLIKHEITMDQNHDRVKTFLLFLLLYDTDSVIRGELTKPNLKDPKQCSKLLKDAYCKEMLDELKPLDFSNFSIVSSGMTETILIKISDNLYGFIHQTFKNAVAFHFCTEHFDTAVKHFPLDVLEKQSFDQFPRKHYTKLIARFMKEIDEGNISKVFACPVFKKECFAKQFSDEVVACNISKFLVRPDTASTFRFPPIFWVSKYCLTSLSRYLFKEIEIRDINKEFYFLLARFGDCCASDESFLRESAAIVDSLESKKLKMVVFGYRNKANHSILHLVLLSEKPDIDCYGIMEYLLKQSALGSFSESEESVLNVIMEQQNRSRILCLLATLNKCKNLKVRPHITKLIQMLPGCEHNVYLELEMLTRLCILFLYIPDSPAQGEAVDMCTNFQHIRALLNLPQRNENEMSTIMEEACRNLPTGPDKEEIGIPNPRGKMSPIFLKTINKIVRHLGKVYAFF